MSINNLNRMSRCGIRTLALGAASLLVPALSSATHAAPAVKDQAHIARAIGETGEDAYDNALAGKWALVSRAATQLQSSSAALPQRWRGMRDQFRLSQSVTSLQSSARSRDRWAAAEAANRVTLFAARLEQPTKPTIPTEITLLDVYGRDLKVAGGRGDTVAARRALRALDSTWLMIRPRVLKAGGTGAAKRFGFALHHALSSGSARKMGAESTLVLDEVDSLEKVFTH